MPRHPFFSITAHWLISAAVQALRHVACWVGKALVLWQCALGMQAQAADHEAMAPVVRLGALSVVDEADALRRWQPLAQYLQTALGLPVALQVHDLAAFEHAVAQGTLDFVVTNPGQYVLLEARYGATRIATLSAAQGNPAHVVGSAVVVRAQGDFAQALPTALEQLRGLRLAAVAQDAFGGYQLAAAAWLRQGVDLQNGAMPHLFTGYPMQRVAQAVLSGQADVGIVRTCLLEQWERDGVVPPGALYVVPAAASAQEGAAPDAVPETAPGMHVCRSSTPLYPGWAFAALPAAAPERSRQVLLALLNQPAQPVARAAAMDAELEVPGVWSVPADYHAVHDVLRQLQVPPYAFLRDTSMPALLRRHWGWVAAVLGVLLVGAAYLLHVEVLVKRRTAQLTHSLQERERLARQNAQHQEALGHLSRLSILGELSAMLAHELNHPLATISNYAAGLRRRVAQGQLTPQALEQALEDIAQESERAARVIGSVRALARKRVPERRPVAPLVLAQQALDLLRGGQYTEIQLHSACGAEHWRVQGDAQQLLQVLLNLLQNARDVHRQCGCEGQAIELEIATEDGQLALSVRDHGPPLSPEALAQLFTPFHTTKPDGLGLGLSISRGIAEAHGGALRARTVAAQDGGGMRMVLLLPLADADPASAMTPVLTTLAYDRRYLTALHSCGG